MDVCISNTGPCSYIYNIMVWLTGVLTDLCISYIGPCSYGPADRCVDGYVHQLHWSMLTGVLMDDYQSVNI